MPIELNNFLTDEDTITDNIQCPKCDSYDTKVDRFSFSIENQEYNEKVTIICIKCCNFFTVNCNIKEEEYIIKKKRLRFIKN